MQPPPLTISPSDLSCPCLQTKTSEKAACTSLQEQLTSEKAAHATVQTQLTSEQAARATLEAKLESEEAARQSLQKQWTTLRDQYDALFIRGHSSGKMEVQVGAPLLTPSANALPPAGCTWNKHPLEGVLRSMFAHWGVTKARQKGDLAASRQGSPC